MAVLWEQLQVRQHYLQDMYGREGIAGKEHGRLCKSCPKSFDFLYRQCGALKSLKSRSNIVTLAQSRVSESEQGQGASP